MRRKIFMMRLLSPQVQQEEVSERISFYKAFFFFIFFSFSLPLTSLNAETEEEEKYGVLVEDNKGDALNKIIEEIPKTQSAISDCEAQIEAGTLQRDKKDDCVWGSFDSNEQNAILELLENYKSQEEQTRNPSSDGETGIGHKYNFGNFKKKKTKSIKILEEYLQKRLEEALYGKEANNGKLRVNTDHTNFYRLWHSQLGKGLITQLSNYCIYSNPFNGFVPYKGNKETYVSKPGGTSEEKFSHAEIAEYYKKENLKNLKRRGTSAPDRANCDSSAPEAYCGFNQCIQNISKDCRNPVARERFFYKRDTSPETSQKEMMVNALSDITDLDNLEDRQNIIHPCELNRYMTGVKKVLRLMKDGDKGIVSEMDKYLQKAGVGGFVGIANVDIKGAIDTDKVTNIASGEIMKAENTKGEKYVDALREEAENLNNCIENNPEQCKEYLLDEDEKKNISDEFYLRSLALGKKIEKNLDPSTGDVEKDDLKNYFKEKGMSDENFELLLKKEKQDCEIRNRRSSEAREDCSNELELAYKVIKEFYKNEKEALHESLESRLAKGDSKQKSLKKIKGRIEQSAEDFAAVLHYNNVVSSFLKVDSGGDREGTNTKALAAELDNNFFDNSGRDPATGSGNSSGYDGDLSMWGDRIEDEKEDDENLNSSSSLEAGQVDVLQYGIEK